ncbi:MAG: hypothetical protein WA974_04905 [Thermodesulfobacteriota bacterium]
MVETTGKVGQKDFEKMKEIIDQIERRLLDLKKLGGEMPVVEKNVRAMMSFIHALKFGISDIVETD